MPNNDRELIMEHRDLHSMAIEQSFDTIIITDTNDSILYVNPMFETVTGYSREQAIGRPIKSFNGHPEREPFHDSIFKKLATCDTWSGRMTSKKIDGTLFEEDVTVSPIKNENGDTVSWIWVRRDLSEIAAMEAQLRQSQRLESIGRLAAGIAHEINTPMQYIGDNTRFLQESFTDLLVLGECCTQLIDAAKHGEIPQTVITEIEAKLARIDVEYLSAEIPGAVSQSLDGIERVTKIVRAMKEFSHPGKEEKTAADLNKAIETTITIARNEWKYFADVTTDFDTDLPLVACLPGEINQVILNLIVNAAHAISAVYTDTNKGKGLITLSTRRMGDSVEIRVTDTGSGIPEHARGKIFDPFFTTKEVGKGTGQGLSVARNVIVEKHGGTIVFETEVGKGTTFIIRLPIKCPSAE